MSVRREVLLTVDVPNNQLIRSDTDSGERRERVDLNRGDQYLFQISARTVTGASSVDYTYVAGTQFLLGLDNVFGTGHTDLVLSNDSLWNIAGDWASLDVLNGKFSARANFNTTDLQAVLENSGTPLDNQQMHLVAWAIPPAPDAPYMIFHLPVNVDNIAVEPVPSVAPGAGLTYVTTDQLFQFDEGSMINGAGGPLAVSFPFAFASAPSVVPGLGDNITEVIQVEIMTTTTTGFTYQVRDTSGSISTTAWNLQYEASLSFDLSNKEHKQGNAINGPGTPIAVVFGTPFTTNIPEIILGVGDNATEVVNLEVLTKSLTGFTFQVRNTAGIDSTSALKINYIATADP